MGSNQWRYGNVVLGVWLFISAFLWRHTQVQFTNTWILGVIVVVATLLSLRVSGLRIVDTLAGIWLFVTAFAMPTLHIGTVWNNAVVGALVFLVSLASWNRAELRPRRHAAV